MLQFNDRKSAHKIVCLNETCISQMKIYKIFENGLSSYG